jgi:hypothetical protein
MTIGSHQRTIGKSQVRITPRSILDPLGHFDTDPCAANPRPWDCAARNITERDDSLSMDWRAFGRVWLNPPFDRRVVGDFIRRMAEHDHGIALVHVRTETEWFKPIWDGAAALLFLAGRYIFHNADGSRCTVESPSSKHYGKPANSGAPILLAAFGFPDADVLSACGIDGHFVPLRFPRGVLVAMIGAQETWREAVMAWLRERDEPVSLDEIYRAFAKHPKARANPNWRAKVRQTLKRADARRTGRARYSA